MVYVNQRVYFGLYLVAVLLYISFTIVALIMGGGKVNFNFNEESYYIDLIGSLFMGCGGIIFYMLIYKMWKILPSNFARTTPGKAIGFSFIPVFNFYWFFPVIWGWSKDYNRYSKSIQSDLPSINERLALAIALFSGVGGIVGMIAGMIAFHTGSYRLTTFVFFIPILTSIFISIFIFKVCKALNMLPTEIIDSTRQSSLATSNAGSRSFGIGSLITGILSIIIPYVGFICGIVAIILSLKQRKIKQREFFHESFSTAGLITGIIGTALWGIGILILLIIYIVYHS